MKRMLLLAMVAAVGWAALADTADALWRRRARYASNNCNCTPAGQPYQANYAPGMQQPGMQPGMQQPGIQQPGIVPNQPLQPGQPTFQTQPGIQPPAPGPANLQGGANLQGNPAGANVQGGANLGGNRLQGNTGVTAPGTP